MATRAYILIESAVGTARAVYKGVQAVNLADARVLSVEAVTGPFDIIALLESDDLDKMGRAVTEGIQRLQGVQRTTTCLVIKLG
jgi:DNA-binding Lrp family transcriptional regulator